MEKHFKKFKLLNAATRESLEALLTDVFVNKSSVWDVLIDPKISVEFDQLDWWKIKISVQIIWTEANIWVKPLELCIFIGSDGQISHTNYSCDDYYQSSRFCSLVQESSLWKKYEYNEF